MKWIQPFLLAAVFIPIMDAHCSAEDTVILNSGTWIRLSSITHLDRPLLGTFVSLTEKTISMKVKGQPDFFVTSLSAVTKLEVSQGKALKGPVIGGSIGFLAGAGLGVVGWMLGCGYESGEDCSTKEYVLAGAGFGALGAVPGAIVGAIIGPEKWNELPLGQVRTGIFPRYDGGIMFSASFSF